ncbi:hypothetical protein HMPREF0724_11893 [Prescottella equi ATCC 33707]|uniref:Uncharacterized protein n=1 Tax=Prescottella equi ATCC 33707 TaxID=525370 RepID=F1TJ20_RHOHA|nr:hypothetical protein HMPREF0724_11893 [Prescottella equi ATCC 33707]
MRICASGPSAAFRRCALQVPRLRWMPPIVGGELDPERCDGE